MRLALLAAIRAYQRYLSPYKGFDCACRAHLGKPSCSAFGYRAVRRYGMVAGLALIRLRTQRCGALQRRLHPPRARHVPLAQGGFCDVPDIACDLPSCDLPSCEVPSCDLASTQGCGSAWDALRLCEVVSYCDCGTCDWRPRRRRERGERYVAIPPNADLRQQNARHDA